MKKLLLSIVLLAVVLPSVFGLTASIGNPRAIIRTEGSPDNPTILDRTLNINNRNDIPVKVHLTPDKTLRHFISDYEPEIILDPGQSVDVPYRLTIDRGGRFDGKINVGFWPHEEEGGNGAGLTATLIILSEGPVIEFPPEAENQSIFNPPVEVVPGDPSLIEENGTVRVSQDVLIEPEVVDAPDAPIATGQTTHPTGPKGPSPIAGIIIVALVIGVGLAAYYAVKK